MDPIRTLIVDDEPLARRRIAQLLAEQPDFVVRGECGSGTEAVAALTQGPPVDVVFLDVQMPDYSGVQVLQQLPEFVQPLVVFVTAYDHYTLQAFEAHAVDYLLKPVDPDRFARCLAYLRQRLRHLPAGAPAAFSRQLLIKQPGRRYFVPVQQVHYLEASANYVTVHANGEAHLVRSTLSQLARQLDPAVFLRIHRSLIVNTQYIKELRPWAHGEYLLTLLDGTHLTSSRGCSEEIQQFLKQFVA